MPKPHPIFPEEIWDGSTGNRDRSDFQIFSDPDAHDWDTITVEMIAVQELLAAGITFQPVESSIVLSNTVYEAVYLIDASEALQITLPDPDDQRYALNFKRIDNTGYPVTILPFGNELIQGDTSMIIAFQWSNLKLVTDHTDWFVL